MTHEPIEIANKHFPHVGAATDCRPFGSGHINDTYLVDTSSGRFILQRVNKKVFNIRKLVSNYELLVRRIKVYQDSLGTRITPEIFPTRHGSYHYIDEENYAWRLVEFLDGATAYDIAPKPETSYHAARAIGNYQLFLNTIDPSEPCDTISGFHDLPGRLAAYRKALRDAEPGLLNDARMETEKTGNFDFIAREVSRVLPELTRRVNHNDTKLNNILFFGGQTYVIDLDTVMRGYVMFDYGDMVRTFTSPAYEDERDPEKTRFRLEHFEALTKGYLESVGRELTSSEKENLLLGALYIIYEQVLRFLTDYLKGDVYYKVAYPGHNLVRTRTQLKLLEAIIDQRTTLEEIIRKYL